MQFTQQFWEYLKTAGPEFGQPDDADVGFLVDNSAVVTVQYIMPAEQWEALIAKWEAQSALGSAEPMTTEVTEGPFYLLDQFSGVVSAWDAQQSHAAAPSRPSSWPWRWPRSQPRCVATNMAGGEFVPR